MTDVIVLAAGLGRRLSGATGLPKWLVPVTGACPADAHLRAFVDAGVGRVLVVTPPHHEHIDAQLAPWRDELDLEVVPNDHSADRNNWYSLLLGLEARRARVTADVVVLNSDLYADSSWFSTLLGAVGRSGHPSELAVDRARGRTDEAMKVEVDADGGLVRAIGKVGIPEPGGEYVGMAWWMPSAADELCAVLASFVDRPERSDHWYEHAIQEHLAAGARVLGVSDVPTGRWVEIDDEHDLAQARALTDG